MRKRIVELVKKVEGFKVFKRRDGRFAVETANGKAVNGEEKVKVLLAEGLIKVTEPAPAEEAPAEEAAAEESAEGEEQAAE